MNNTIPKIHYLIGDVTKPIFNPSYIVHICNNQGGWGKGFVTVITKVFGNKSENFYRIWSKEKDFQLGKIQIVEIDQNISIVNMIAQDGYKSTYNPHPLNLKALEQCLKQVYLNVENTNITIHMPRIGCGLAGGYWEDVESIIQKTITVHTYVYDLKFETKLTI
jgi:O-acetyl-ADP-ribose deacetylase (regulator of RNase III)